MHTKSYINLLALCLTAILAVSCSTSRKAVTPTPAPTATTTFSVDDHLAALSRHYDAAKGLTAKVKVTVNAEGNDISTSGSLKMKKDEIIQLTLIDPILGLMEVGRMEFTPKRVLIIDRINKQYIDEPYTDISFLQMANVDFNTLQSLFWNELFVPGSKGKADASQFTYTTLSASDVNLDYQDRLLHYQFTSDYKDNKLLKAHINNPKDNRYDFSFDYDKFVNFNQRQFPSEMTMKFTAEKRKASLALSLSSMKATTDDIEATKPSSKYTKVSAEKIFKLLGNR